MPYEHILATVVALSIGLSLVALVRRWLKSDSGALLVAVLFAPVIVFLGMSGQLVEFKGFGLEAKFRAIASTPIKATAVVPTSPSVSAIEAQSEAKRHFSIGSQVVVLREPSGTDNNGSPNTLEVATKIYPGLLDATFEALVVLDDQDRVIGYFPRTYFYDLLRIELVQFRVEPEPVGRQLDQTQLAHLVKFPRRTAESEGWNLVLIESISKAEALKQITESGQTLSVVVDHSGRYRGIVVRSVLADELVAAMAGTFSANGK